MQLVETAAGDLGNVCLLRKLFVSWCFLCQLLCHVNCSVYRGCWTLCLQTVVQLTRRGKNSWGQGIF